MRLRKLEWDFRLRSFDEDDSEATLFDGETREFFVGLSPSELFFLRIENMRLSLDIRFFFFFLVWGSSGTESISLPYLEQDDRSVLVFFIKCLFY